MADGCQTCGLVVHRLPAEIQRPTVDEASFVLVRIGSTAHAPAKPRATLARVAANTRRCRPVFGLKAAVLDVLEWMSRRQFWPWRCNRRINQTRQLFSRLKTPAFSIAGIMLPTSADRIVPVYWGRCRRAFPHNPPHLHTMPFRERAITGTGDLQENSKGISPLACYSLNPRSSGIHYA